MPKVEKILSVCRRCGAVAGVKQTSCNLCGAQLDQTMVLKPRKDRGSFEITLENDASKERNKKQMTVVSLLSLIAGFLALISLTPRLIPIPIPGLFLGVVAVVLAIVAFCQRKGGTLLSVLGLILGGYTVFVYSFYYLWQFFYLFLD